MAAVPASAVASPAGADPAAPVVSAPEASRTSADVGDRAQQVTISVHIAASADVGPVYLSLTNVRADVSYTTEEAPALLAGSARTGRWGGTVTLPRHAPTGSTSSSASWATLRAGPPPSAATS